MAQMIITSAELDALDQLLATAQDVARHERDTAATEQGYTRAQMSVDIARRLRHILVPARLSTTAWEQAHRIEVDTISTSDLELARELAHVPTRQERRDGVGCCAPAPVPALDACSCPSRIAGGDCAHTVCRSCGEGGVYSGLCSDCQAATTAR